MAKQWKFGGKGFIIASMGDSGGGVEGGGDYSIELAAQERNTEQAGRTGTKDATVGASNSRALTHSNRGLSTSL